MYQGLIYSFFPFHRTFGRPRSLFMYPNTSAPEFRFPRPNTITLLEWDVFHNAPVRMFSPST